MTEYNKQLFTKEKHKYKITIYNNKKERSIKKKFTKCTSRLKKDMSPEKLNLRANQEDLDKIKFHSIHTDI